MKVNRACFPLSAMCRVLGLSTSGYSDWLWPGPSARERRDAELRRGIRRIWCESGKTYGCPPIHAALRDEGERVARLMREMGIEGASADWGGFLSRGFLASALARLLRSATLRAEIQTTSAGSSSCRMRVVVISARSPTRAARWIAKRCWILTTGDPASSDPH